jgi:hypothetical protein
MFNPLHRRCLHQVVGSKPSNFALFISFRGRGFSDPDDYFETLEVWVDLINVKGQPRLFSAAMHLFK